MLTIATMVKEILLQRNPSYIVALFQESDGSLSWQEWEKRLQRAFLIFVSQRRSCLIEGVRKCPNLRLLNSPLNLVY